ncbi:hypothetical protein [Rhizobium grahamii]|uniref:hypothetical protein n=1 Tax=Rhizobium grahamii TaxID=1120045 RepID=UPI00159ECF99|nr:hypothetical protein [Rhizobium grahamii]
MRSKVRQPRRHWIAYWQVVEIDPPMHRLAHYGDTARDVLDDHCIGDDTAID